MTITLDTESRQTIERTCTCCGAAVTRTTCAVFRDGQAYAVVLSSQYHHRTRETFIDVVFGTWDDDSALDHVTLGCRIGYENGQPRREFVDAADVLSDDPLYGVKISRDQAEVHPLREQFWQIVDQFTRTI
jgi:hypothetical protein